MKPRRLLLLGLSALLLPHPLWAQGIDMTGGGPVDITSNDGIEWRQAEQVVIARGNARAVRDNVTVDADRLLARYRQAPAAAGAAPRQAAATTESPLGGSSEIWRMEAEGHVRITTPTDTAVGDRAVYDIDQAVLVLTGREPSLTTPNQVITARDSLEYWSQRKVAVARGNALVVDNAENRRVSADTLVAYFVDTPGAPGSPARPGAAAPPRGPAPPPIAAPASTGPVRTPSGAEVPGAGKLDRVELFGNVEIRTITDVVRGDRGVYSPATGMARLLGNVRITRGDNQVNGREAIVNLRTGVARLVSAPGERVQGLVMPQQGQTTPGSNTPPAGSDPLATPNRREQRSR